MVETTLVIFRHPMRHAERKSAAAVNRNKRSLPALIAGRCLGDLNLEVHSVWISMLPVLYDKIKFVLQSKDAGELRIPGI